MSITSNRCASSFEAIKLPYTIVIELVQMGVDRKLLQNLGTRESENMAT